MTSPHQRTKRGFTLVEAAITLGVIGFAIGALYLATGSVNQNRNINNALADMLMVSRNIQQLYRGSSIIVNPNNFTTANMVRARVFPASMLNGATPQTPWGSNITLGVGPTADTFSLTYNGLTELYCRNLVGRVAGRGRSPTLLSIVAAGSTFSTIVQLDSLGATSLALAGCNSAVFTFRLK
jgi:type II secretory pathway pseudopilin PulG